MMNRRALGFVADLLNWPRRAICWHEFSLVTVGNALTKLSDTNQRHNSYAFQNTAADGNTSTNGFKLRPGSYTMNVLGITNASYGKVDWYIDNALAVSAQDWYSAGATYNVIKTATVQVYGVSPWHTLKAVVNGKNASSSDYILALTLIEFVPSAD